MKIRLAADEDIPALFWIAQQFFQHNAYREHSWIDAGSLEKTLRLLMQEHVLLVAEVAGRVVGAAGAMIAPLYWNHAQLQGLEFVLWLDPEHRGGGNGKLLRQRLEDEGKAKGVRFWNMIALEASMPEQVGAMYRQAGFKLVEHVYLKVL